MAGRARSLSARKVAVAVLAVLLPCSGAAVAWAELGIGISLEEGMTIMGGPVRPHLAAPDAVTAASVDAITTASRISHGGGVHLHLTRGGGGELVLGAEYVHYRFDLDYDFARAQMQAVAMRILVMARLPLLHFRGAPVLTIGFGGYAELLLYDEAEIAGSWVNIDTNPLGGGLVVDVNIHPYRFALPRGHLVPGIFARAYRGVLPQLNDERGSAAPLSDIAFGVSIRYDLPGAGEAQITP